MKKLIILCVLNLFVPLLAMEAPTWVDTLKQAWREQNKPLVQSLLEKAKQGIEDINAKDAEGNTALIAALLDDKLKIANELITIPGLNFNIRGAHGVTALMAGIGYLLRQNILQQPGIEVNAQDDNGLTALMKAMSRKDAGAVEDLLRSHTIDVNIQDKEGRTALMMAEHWSIEHKALRNAFLNILNMTDLNISLADKKGQTALRQAINAGDRGNAQLLWLMGADDQGVKLSPEMENAKFRGKEILQTLIQLAQKDDLYWLQQYSEEFPLNVRDPNHNTLLHIAISYNQIPVANYFVQTLPGLLRVKNKQGHTPLEEVYGQWGDQNDAWNAFLVALPASFAPDIKEAHEKWLASRQKDIEELEKMQAEHAQEAQKIQTEQKRGQGTQK